jgi:hypothetical protein
MTGLEDARESEILVLADETADVRRVCFDVCIFGRCEGGRELRSDGEREGFATEPVALVVPVAVDESHLDAAVEKGTDLRELLAAHFSVFGRDYYDGRSAGEVQWNTELKQKVLL